MRHIYNITREYDSTNQATTTRETAVTLYTFDELNDDARARVLEEYCEERANDPYFGQRFTDDYEREIWNAVRDLEKSITGTRVQWRYNRWYSADFDCEYLYDDCYEPCALDTVDDNGYWCSMDICDAWNAHIRKLNAINAHIDYIFAADHENDVEYMGLVYVWGDNRLPSRPGAKHARRYSEMIDELYNRWYAELEAACEDVRNTIESLLRAEWDYYTSEEFAREECADECTQGGEYRTRDNSGRVYYSDDRKWYTVDGEFFEQSDVTRECVSIVKAA